MWSEIRRNPLALFYALLIHAALLALVTFGLDWDSQPEPVKRANVIEAVAVDQARVDQELKKIRDAEAERERKKDEAIKTREREEKKLAEVKKQQAAEKKRLTEIEKKREAKAAEAKRQQAAEKKRLAAAEKKRRDEEARLAALEAQRKIDEKKRQAAAESERKRRAEETAERQREIQAEAARQAAESDRVAQSTAARYQDLIRDRVERSWLRPVGLPDGLQCVLAVRLDPFGEVLEARIVRSSGNPLFDRSAEAAVKKASPLPVPSDVTIYNRFFREFQFKFNPEK